MIDKYPPSPSLPPDTHKPPIIHKLICRGETNAKRLKIRGGKFWNFGVTPINRLRRRISRLNPPDGAQRKLAPRLWPSRPNMAPGGGRWSALRPLLGPRKGGGEGSRRKSVARVRRRGGRGARRNKRREETIGRTTTKRRRKIEETTVRKTTTLRENNNHSKKKLK